MAVDMFIKLKGQKQGDIQGESTDKAHPNWIVVESFSWGIVSPRDAASGLPTGKRIHREFRWVSRGQKSSPKLMQALANNENIVEATLVVPRASATGSLSDTVTFKFTNANISSFDVAGAAEANGVVSEEFAMTYQKIEVTHNPTGTFFSDDWESPVA